MPIHRLHRYLGWPVLSLVAVAGCFGSTGEVTRRGEVRAWVVESGEDPVVSPADLDTSGRVLTLRRAIFEALASEGPDIIVFDDERFPLAAPVVIALHAPLPPLREQNLAIDASGAGIVLDGAALLPGAAALSIEADGVAVLGVAFRDVPGAAVRVEPVVGVKLEGLSISGGTTGVTATGVWLGELRNNRIEATAADGLSLAESYSSILVDNVVTAPGGHAIALDAVTDLLVANNRIDGPGLHGVWAHASVAVQVDGNTILLASKSSSSQHGVVLEGTSQSRVRNNFIDPGDGFLVHLVDAPDNELVGNILDGADTAIVLEGDSDRNLMLRNVIMNTVYDGIYLGSGAEENVVVHNTYYQSAGLVLGGGTATVDANNLDADDGFVDPGAFDFHLLDPSPAVDAGTDLGYDLLPALPARYLGAAPDLGAVETR